MIAQWAIDRDLLAAHLLRLVNEASRIEPKDQALLDRIATLQAFRRRVAGCGDPGEFDILRQQWDAQNGATVQGVEEI